MIPVRLFEHIDGKFRDLTSSFEHISSWRGEGVRCLGDGFWGEYGAFIAPSLGAGLAHTGDVMQ